MEQRTLRCEPRRGLGPSARGAAVPRRRGRAWLRAAAARLGGAAGGVGGWRGLVKPEEATRRRGSDRPVLGRDPTGGGVPRSTGRSAVVIRRLLCARLRGQRALVSA